MTTPAAALHTLLSNARTQRSAVAMPGSFNGLCARAVAKAGFSATYVSGAATTVCAGVPDIGVLSLDHFCRVIREVYDSSGLPLIADADTGFGEAEMMRRTVVEYSRAGAAGMHIEDQKFPKRCGHLDGKELVPVDHMIEKVQWAAKAAKDVGGFVVCARTDARGVEGIDAAIERAASYVLAGADMIFPEGLANEQEFERFAAAMSRLPRRPYLLANMTEFGKTPIIPLKRFGELGYECVIWPVSLLRAAMKAVDQALAAFARDGSAASILPNMQTRQELYGLVEYTPGVAWEYPVRE